MVSGKKLPEGDSTASSAYVRDQDYYFEDGIIVVLAGDTLFKIHRTLFERHSPFFEGLLSLPQNSDQKSSEGNSDENPIVCPDTTEDFRALCWVVYPSLADIVAQQTWSTINVPKLICVVAITHKYEFTAYCDWAWNALVGCYTGQPGDFFRKCGTWLATSRIFKLAAECGKKSLVDQLEQTWLGQISTSIERTRAFTAALDTVEGLDSFREFHAKCYYAYLTSSGAFAGQMHGVIPIDLEKVGSQIDDSLAGLNRGRRMRLLTGFWSLSRLRVRLLLPPKLADNPSCTNHNRDCIAGWESWWNGATSSAVGVGEPKRLIEHISEKARQNIGRWKEQSSYYSTIPTIVAIPCHSVVQATIESVKRDFDTSLASRFMIP